MGIQFKKAIKHEAKGRVAIVGPAGSGKSFTSLRLATLLAGTHGKIAAIDTEHGSLSKYADLFGFDVFELDSFSPANFIDALDEAERQKYDVFITDSLSHFWTGKDGALEFVDMAAKRHKDNMGGWKDFRPHERQMVDRMIASPCHIIVTMRTKTEYVEEVNPSTGKKMRRKVGLQPVQREGLEYEFDLVAYMDDENTLIVDKTRCSAYSGKAFTKPGVTEFEAFQEWLKGAAADAPVKPVESETAASRPTVRQKITEAKKQFEKTFGEEGRKTFMAILGSHGAENVDSFETEQSAVNALNELTSMFKAMRAEAQKAQVA